MRDDLRDGEHSPTKLAMVLRQGRTAKGFTLRYVESKTGISNAYLSQLETGKIDSPSPHILHKLASLYDTPYETLMRSAGYLDEIAPPIRDIFLSHRSADKDFVRELAADIEAENYNDRSLLSWLDEAEVRPGESLPGMINEGLEKSRFIALVMTPAYFQSESGWTDAEWHASLHTDPDNRRGRIIPLLVNDCPYIPYLLRHLKAIDFRGQRYEQGFKELLAVLKDEPLPRPVTHRGQLITTGSRIDRSSLVAERAVPDADPDVITERLYCNLLPIERLPRHVYAASISPKLIRQRRSSKQVIPSKARLKEVILAAQEASGVERRFMPAFRIFEDKIISFHDLDDPDSPLSAIIDDNDVEIFDVTNFIRDEDLRKILISLMNMALDRHLFRIGLTTDRTKESRYFFPPKDGDAHEITWTPRKKKAVRTVAKPIIRDGKVVYWRHLGAYLQVTFLVNKFYIKISPTWVITEDGFRLFTGPNVTRRVAKWTGPERNMQVLYHVRFWTSVMRGRRGGPISIWAGDQVMEIATVPALIQQSYGIAYDRKDLMGLLDEEAPLIAAEEEELVDIALEDDIADEELEDIINNEAFNEEINEDATDETLS